MKIITNAKITKGYEHWKQMFEENEKLRQEYGLNVLAYGHPKDNNEEIYTVIDVESMDKMQEMLKLPEMIKLRTEAGVDLDTQKFILLEGGNQDCVSKKYKLKNIKNIDTNKPNLKVLSIIEYSFLPTYLFLIM